MQQQCNYYQKSWVYFIPRMVNDDHQINNKRFDLNLKLNELYSVRQLAHYF